MVSVLEGGYKTQGRIISPFGRSVAAHVRTLTQCNTVGVWNSEREISNVIAEINAEKIREQSELLVPETPRELSTAALLSPTASSSATTTLGKRRRTQVDYASLDAKMRAEEAALKTPNP